MLCVVHGVLCVVHGVLCVLYGVRLMGHAVWYVLYGKQCVFAAPKWVILCRP